MDIVKQICETRQVITFTDTQHYNKKTE